MRLLTILLVILSLSSCTSDIDPFAKMNDFDQGPMLENLGNNLILLAYRDFAEKTLTLQTTANAFGNEPSSESLIALRDALKSARLSWQYCSPYQFGPAESYGLSGLTNIYPVDTLQVNRNVTSESYDLRTLSNADARGFQALGYLLYSPNKSDTEILAEMNTAKISYIQSVIALMQSGAADVYHAWRADGDNYIGTFTSKEAFGVNVGSSVGKLVNSLNLDFERNTRDGKVGIPVGIRTLGEPIPHATEAFYAGYSVELIRVNIEAYHQLYLGAEDEGLDDYLRAIAATTTGNEDLAEKIEAQFQTIKNLADQLQDPLTLQIDQNKETVQAVFSEMHRLAVLFKTDMASTMGVIIAYQDNDGD